MAVSNRNFPNRRTGHKRDTFDKRDFKREYGGHEIPSIKDPVVDLRGYVYCVYNQGKLNSCAANVLCALYGLLLQKKAQDMNIINYDFDPARLFVYYNARYYNLDVTVDSGVSLRASLKMMHSFGVCHERYWPYDIDKFAKRPSSASFKDAAWNNIIKYESLKQNIDQFRACLKNGSPFAFGFEVYESFDRITGNGLMPIPSAEEIASSTVMELHAVLAVGYNDYTKCITVLNSWGDLFGDRGYFYMPYEYIIDPDRVFDFWKVDNISNSGLNP